LIAVGAKVVHEGRAAVVERVRPILLARGGQIVDIRYTGSGYWQGCRSTVREWDVVVVRSAA